MEGERTDIQGAYFNAMRKERRTVAIYLISGKKLVGRIKAFDKFTLLLEGHGGEQVVYKHAVSSVGAWSANGKNSRPESRAPEE